MSTEIYQEYGNDLVLNANGDLLSVDSTELVNQRIIRRLLTVPISVSKNPDYTDQPTYGAGVSQFIGQPLTPNLFNQIKALITSQMYLEPTVSQTPPPEISLTGLPDRLNCTIKYTNLLTNQQAVIELSLP